MSKTHWKSLTDNDYIGAYSLEDGKDLDVTIVSVAREEITADGGRKEEVTIAQLQDQKPFIINATNAKTISKAVGSPYIEDWEGRSVTLYVSTTRFQGEEVECLRVRDFAPAEAVDNKAALKKLKGCKTLSGLQKAYMDLSRAEQADKEVIALKDELKSELQ